MELLQNPPVAPIVDKEKGFSLSFLGGKRLALQNVVLYRLERDPIYDGV